MTNNTNRQIWVLTNYGIGRINATYQAQSTERIYITKIKLGSGKNNSYEPPVASQTDLYSPIEGAVFPVIEKSKVDNTVTFKSEISATSGGYTVREIGLYETIDGVDYLFAVGACEDLIKPEYDAEDPENVDNYGYVMSIEYKLNITSVNLATVYDQIILDENTEYIKKEDLEALARTVLFVEGNLMDQISNNSHLLGLNRAQQLAELIESNKEEYAESAISGLFSDIIGSKGNEVLKFRLDDINKVGFPSVTVDGILTESDTDNYVKCDTLSLHSDNILVNFEFTWYGTNPSEAVELYKLSNGTTGYSFKLVQLTNGNIQGILTDNNGVETSFTSKNITTNTNTCVELIKTSTDVTLYVNNIGETLNYVFPLSMNNSTVTIGCTENKFYGSIDLSNFLIRVDNELNFSFKDSEEINNLDEYLKGFWVFNYTDRYSNDSIVPDFSIFGNNLSLSQPLSKFKTGRQGILPYIEIGDNSEKYFFEEYNNSLKIKDSFTIIFAGSVKGNGSVSGSILQQNQNWMLEVDDISSGCLKLTIYSEGGAGICYKAITSTTSLLPNKNYVIVVEFDGSNAKMFINGVKVKTEETINGRFSRLSTTNNGITSSSLLSGLWSDISCLSLINATMNDSTIRALSLSLLSLLGTNVYRSM